MKFAKYVYSAPVHIFEATDMYDTSMHTLPIFDPEIYMLYMASI